MTGSAALPGGRAGGGARGASTEDATGNPTARPLPDEHKAPPGRSELTGTWTLLRFMARRDRLRLSLWVLGIGLMSFYVANAVQALVASEDDLTEMAVIFTDPVGRLMTGPAYGMEDATFERFYAAGYVLFIYVLIALMSIFTVTRHTRAEEQSGRAELLRAGVVGRHATQSAALALVLAANVFAALLVLLGALSGGFAWEGSVLVAVSGAAVGLFFTGVATTTAQLTASARAASAMSGGLLGLSYLVRMGGDMAAPGGTALSWFSPLGWSQQTAPYVLDRWWPVLPLLAGGAVLLGLGRQLSLRRDFGAGLLPQRLGRARARPSLGTPEGAAVQNLLGGLRGWGIALVLSGMMFGGYAQTMSEAAGDLPEQFQLVFSGDSLMLGYLSYMAVFLAIFVGAAAVNGIHQMRAEEASGRAELTLSAPLSRTRWFAAHLSVLLVGLASTLVLVGLGTGVTAAAVLDDDAGRHLLDVLLASVHQAPAVFAVLGIVLAGFGWVPRAGVPAGWLIIGWAAVMTNFGEMLQLPEAALQLNVFGHLSSYPAEPIAWAPVLGLSVIGALGTLLGFAGFRRREIHSG